MNTNRIPMSEIEARELSDEERQSIADADIVGLAIQSGSHLDDWLKLGPALIAGRKLALSVSHSLEPTGRPYNAAFGEWLACHEGLLKLKKHDRIAILWLFDEPERLAKLGEIRATMTPGERSRLNAPMSAMAKVKRLLDGPAAPKEAKATVAQRLEETEAELAEAKTEIERLGDERGGNIDLERGTVREWTMVLRRCPVTTHQQKKLRQLIEVAEARIEEINRLLVPKRKMSAPKNSKEVQPSE